MKNKIGENIDVGICKKCGLPKEICICDDIIKEGQDIVIYAEKRKYQKIVTIISELDMEKPNLLSIAKFLKIHLACGGGIRGSSIILQGDHLKRIKDLLILKGFDSDKIRINNNGGIKIE